MNTDCRSRRIRCGGNEMQRHLLKYAMQIHCIKDMIQVSSQSITATPYSDTSRDAMTVLKLRRIYKHSLNLL